MSAIATPRMPYASFMALSSSMLNCRAAAEPGAFIWQIVRSEAAHKCFETDVWLQPGILQPPRAKQKRLWQLCVFYNACRAAALQAFSGHETVCGRIYANIGLSADGHHRCGVSSVPWQKAPRRQPHQPERQRLAASRWGGDTRRFGRLSALRAAGAADAPERSAAELLANRAGFGRDRDNAGTRHARAHALHSTSEGTYFSVRKLPKKREELPPRKTRRFRRFLPRLRKRLFL